MKDCQSPSRLLTCIFQLLPRQFLCNVAFCLPYSHCNTSFLQGYQCSGIHDEKQQGKNHNTEGCLLRESKNLALRITRLHTRAQLNRFCSVPNQLSCSQGLSNLISYLQRLLYKSIPSPMYLNHTPEDLLRVTANHEILLAKLG